MKYYNYYYSVIDADLSYHITTHPTQQMRNLGFHVVKSEPFIIGDCWWFRTDNQVDNLPAYIKRLADDFRFSDEQESEEPRPRREPPIYSSDGTLTDYGKYKLGEKYKDI